MKKEITDWAVIAAKIVSWALSVLAIIWIILKLTNHSPSAVQVILAFQAIIFAALLGVIKMLFDFTGEMREFRGTVNKHMKECDRRFHALATDFKNTDSEFRKNMIKYHEAKYS